MKYYISDVHFGHRNILEFEDRPFENTDEMDEEYIRRWNAKVGKGDEVYILGDLSFHRGEGTVKILKRLNGMKFLVKGNHDHLFLADKDFDQSLFRWVKDYHIVKDDGDYIVLFHYPIQTWDRKHYGALHFYGHVHSNKGTMHPMLYEITRSYNVGIDIIQEPMTKDEILKFYSEEVEET